MAELQSMLYIDCLREILEAKNVLIQMNQKLGYWYLLMDCKVSSLFARWHKFRMFLTRYPWPCKNKLSSRRYAAHNKDKFGKITERD